jgi:hypothetical protein
MTTAADWRRLIPAAPAAEVTHFAYPFTYGPDRHADVVEQDTEADVLSGVLCALTYRPGERVDDPDFGAADLAFTNQPVDAGMVAEGVSRSEPRADVDTYAAVVDEMTAAVKVAASGGEA